jgi:branched-chain amino acid aminotransferase
VTPIVYWRDRFLPEHDACVSVADRGFLYGDGLFETMRAYGGRVFRLDAHLDRLFAAARVLGLRIPGARRALAAVIDELLTRNRLADAYVRLTVSRGTGPSGPTPTASHQPTLLIVAQPLSLPSAAKYRQGYRAVILPPSVCAEATLPRIKSLSYLPSVLARAAAKRARADEGLLRNSRGQVTEGATSNLFTVRRGKLLTPPVDSGLLPGITRAAVLEIAQPIGVSAREVALGPQDLWAADECFLTNSIIEIMPVTRIDGRPVGTGRIGPVTQRLQEEYRGLVANELG